MTDIQVCIGSVCHLKGSYEIINKLNSLIAENDLKDKLKVKYREEIYTVLPETAEKFFEETVKGSAV